MFTQQWIRKGTLTGALIVTLLWLLVGSAVPVVHAKPKAIITVTSLGDGAANAANCPGSGCRLRDAIAAAGVGDEIQFSVTGTITLGATGQLTTNQNLTITGPAGGITISGADTFQVFYVTGGALTLQNLTIANGNANAGNGGGIRVDGTLNLTNVTVRDSQTTGFGGGIYVDGTGTIVLNNVTISGNRATCASCVAGGIMNYGTATLTNVTISGNQATGTSSACGAISNLGQLTLQNSAVISNTAGNIAGICNSNTGHNATLVNVTISGNTCSNGTLAWGCGFSSNNHATATLTNVTIANNTSPVHGGISNWNSGSATLRNTLDANNSGENCFVSFGTLTSNGYNLSSDTTCNAYFTQASDLNNTNPLLAALALNPPGTTQTHALRLGSPAIDKIPSAGGCGAGVTTDQRGVARPQNLLCDIGAYEFNGLLFYLPFIRRSP